MSYLYTVATNIFIVFLLACQFLLLFCPRPPYPPSPTPSRNPPSLQRPPPPSVPPSVPLLTLPPRPNPPTMKRLTPDEIASRRERGLCFTCDEKYHRGHKCASRVFLFLAEGDEPSETDISLPDPQPGPGPNKFQFTSWPRGPGDATFCRYSR